jgi:hypothetical protein
VTFKDATAGKVTKAAEKAQKKKWPRGHKIEEFNNTIKIKIIKIFRLLSTLSVSLSFSISVSIFQVNSKLKPDVR